MFRRFRQALFCIALLTLSAAMPSAYGADAETRAFTSAEKLFQDKFFQNAEKEFADFVVKYPASPRVAQGLLRQAQAARSGRTIGEVIEDALRLAMARRREAASAPLPDLPVVHVGGLQPGVDLDDSAALLDLMEGVGR